MRNFLSLISKIHDKGNRLIIEELKKNGADRLVPSHGDILVCLYQNDKMTMKEVADKINRTRPTVTVLVDKLEKLGYIKREVSEKDNRYTYIYLTKKGKDFKPVFEKISNKLNDMLYKNLSKDESDILENLLQKI
ncbi:MAG: MarR family transcriptional regulator [Candidatus Gastranaerophilales bacterium]|nr:MarR family transcriptional regulator [Candidatus Gastranaerophilales bacterium]